MSRTSRIARLVLVAGVMSLMVCGCGDAVGPMPEPHRASLPAKNGERLRLVFGGDTMLDDLALPWLLKNGWGYSLAGLQPVFAEADLVGLNLEVPVATSCDRAFLKQYSYFMRPEALAGLTQNGVHAVTLANNHFRDCGEDGMRQTVEHLDRAGLLHYGAAPDRENADRPLVVEIGVTRIGLLGFFGKGESTWRRVLGRDGASPMTEDNLRRLIPALRPQVDVLLVSIHWGLNYKAEVGPKQQKMGHLAIDLGADAVIGHGAHIPQPMELYRGKPIIYSIGNAAFGTGNNAVRDGLLAELVVEGKTVRQVVVYPLRNQNRNEQVRWQTRLATGTAAQATLKRLIRTSAPYGATLRLDGDRAILDL
jgi:poly-gamma-glutamate capsule biosynthesis protein CapA/YwtB (metallophosphatase superfamily)